VCFNERPRNLASRYASASPAPTTLRYCDSCAPHCIPGWGAAPVTGNGVFATPPHLGTGFSWAKDWREFAGEDATCTVCGIRV
jgi:hypothetical protein